MLTVHDLAATRNDQTVFAKVHFTLAPGEALHVVGANGCGKTTLLHILVGLLSPEQGELRWQGRTISECITPYQAQLVYIGHKSGVKNNLTVAENLQLVAKLGQAVAKWDLSHTLGYFGLGHVANTLCKYLSAGQRQRVALARLLILDARLWILDEPFTAIDSGSIAALQALLQQHMQRGGMAILTSHQHVMLPGIKQLSLDQSAAMREPL